MGILREDRAADDLGLDARLAAVTPSRARPILRIDLTHNGTLRIDSGHVCQDGPQGEAEVAGHPRPSDVDTGKLKENFKSKKKVFRRFFFL